jgi:hypothetical protein
MPLDIRTDNDEVVKASLSPQDHENENRKRPIPDIKVDVDSKI